ncbi:hypothetical protein A6V39_04035 [Candidatus Mycoplasma haematobovis]|uniref:Uncharacterized protein n=1 Tax=Candidatus Mycoplasma haematobovis TaxID=432608 RepID=A0A1A9QCU8_9MOLU|nr:hypothetical protein A6V39_04035 [Candidatus Mycoplasma haematobovis]
MIFWEIKSINLDDATTLKDASKFCSDSDRSIMGRIIMEEYEKEKERIKKIIPHLSIDDVKRN